jgi:hypothetical protein
VGLKELLSEASRANGVNFERILGPARVEKTKMKERAAVAMPYKLMHTSYRAIQRRWDGPGERACKTQVYCLLQACHCRVRHLHVFFAMAESGLCLYVIKSGSGINA